MSTSSRSRWEERGALQTTTLIDIWGKEREGREREKKIWKRQHNIDVWETMEAQLYSLSRLRGESRACMSVCAVDASLSLLTQKTASLYTQMRVRKFFPLLAQEISASVRPKGSVCLFCCTTLLLYCDAKGKSFAWSEIENEKLFFPRNTSIIRDLANTIFKCNARSTDHSRHLA